MAFSGPSRPAGMRTPRTQALKLGVPAAKLQEGEHCTQCGGSPLLGETAHSNHYADVKLTTEGGSIPVAGFKLTK